MWERGTLRRSDAPRKEQASLPKEAAPSGYLQPRCRKSIIAAADCTRLTRFCISFPQH
jgi:hypothetical protein